MVKIARLFGALAITLLLVSSVLGADYVGQAAESLKGSNVYVAPGLDGPSGTIAARLSRALRANDSIALVMLPSDADGSIDEVAARLSGALNNERIIGLAVGRNVTAIAPTLPSGVAADLIRRASSVSNDPTTTLITFAQNVHIWQADHPNNEPTAPTPKQEGISIWVILGVTVVLIGSGVLFAINKSGAEEIRLRFVVPNELKDLLEKLAKDSQKVRDPALKTTIYKICTDLEVYFKYSLTDKKQDALFFRDRLQTISDVILAKYLRVQETRQYHNDPDSIMRLGKGAITDFAEYVIEAIRQGNDADLREFKISARTLEAYREVRFPSDKF